MTLLHSLINILLHNQNQFASGGLLLLLVGSIGAYFRKVPAAIYDWFMKVISLRIVITDEVEAFEWFKDWFKDTEIKNTRHVDVTTPVQKGFTITRLGLAPGVKWIWYKNRPLRIEFFRKTNENASYTGSKRTESVEIRTIGRNTKFISDFMTELRSLSEGISKKRASLYTWKSDYWYKNPSFEPRTIESVILPENEKESILEDIKNFYDSEKWYVDTGIPFHRGYLLHGIPGGGKTSLVTGISSVLKARIYQISLNELNDSTLTNAVSCIPANSIILLEDVDSVVPVRDTNESSSQKIPNEIASKIGVSMAGLLNVLDGLQSPHGSLFFLTTNHLSKIDAALLRPGRIDYRIEFKAATKYQKEELYKRFFKTSNVDEQVVNSSDTETMADFQNLLMKLKNNNLERKHE